ncbi:MAG: SLC13 family permease, partial [Marinifilaceae bacterium]|nr:SLC13 family permease [Marinifilaceae bacterium]
ALDDVKGGHLIEIVRFDKEVITPVPADEFIMGGDRLVYSGQIDIILELKRSHGLVNATHPVFSLDEMEKGRKIYTASIDFGCPLIGSAISETDFEQRHGVVLVAVSRRGERIDSSPREIKLRLGDVLLLECPSSFKRSRISEREGLRFFDSEDVPNIGKKTLVSSLIMLAMLLLSTFEVIPILQSCFLAAFAMIITRCCSIEQARDSINWNVLMIFAGSVCLGTAIEKSGIAVVLANGLLNVCGDSPLLVLIAICLLGTFITEFISNTACAAMFYPIAYHAALTMGVNPLTFCVALMIAVSSSFATPIGSPTHMLVYSVGGYRFTDFMKIGILMNIIILAANILIVTLLFPL